MNATIPNLTGFDAGLPANIDAERTILGAILLDNNAWGEVAEKLKADDFALDSHRRIGKAMKTLMDSDTAVDIVTLANLLASHSWIESVGGVAYLASLTEGLPRRPVIEEYIKIVKDKSLLRSLMGICSAAIARAADQSETALEVVGSLQKSIEELAQPLQDTRQAPVAAFIKGVMDRMAEEYRNRVAPCIPSGNAWFDAKTGGGYRMGKYTIVAARPKIGKSGWAGQSIATNCRYGRKVVDFSLEMDKDEVTRNLVPYVVDVPNLAVNRPWNQTPAQNLLVLQGLGQIAEWPLSVYDGAMDIEQICWAMDRETSRGEEVLFVIDHFGLIGGTPGSATNKIRERYVENSTRLRKKIAEKKNCALIVLFQLNPVAREIADKRPLPDDLKESKNPLEDCFAMLLLHRYIDKESLRLTRKANLNLALIRSGGAPGNVECEFNPFNLCFEAQAELDHDEDAVRI